MKICTSLSELAQCLPDANQSLGFVPTMGALHKGHLSLVEESKRQCDFTVMSVFVNPLQFGPKEDFSNYPRPIEQDIALAKTAGVDLFFNPNAKEFYPSEQHCTVTENKMSKVLCGQFRAGHFEGVLTVVLKFLNLIEPTHLFMGQKDAQQLRLIEHMCEQLFVKTEVIACQTYREHDGLAMSSRNVYLNSHERQIAPEIYKALSVAHQAFESGENQANALLQIAKRHLVPFKEIEIQYLELRQWDNLEECSLVSQKSLLAIAAHIGKTRLIDNLVFLG